MKYREKIIKVIDEWASKAVTTNKFDGASVYNPHNAAELADALIAAGIALRGERMKYERLTKKICGDYHGKRFVGGKGVINDREYCRGCFDATAIVDRLGELEDKIESGEIISVIQSEQDEQEIAYFVKHNAAVRKQAVIEFAVRLKKKADSYNYDESYIDRSVMYTDIDDLVTEVCGE